MLELGADAQQQAKDNNADDELRNLGRTQTKPLACPIVGHLSVEAWVFCWDKAPKTKSGRLFAPRRGRADETEFYFASDFSAVLCSNRSSRRSIESRRLLISSLFS